MRSAARTRRRLTSRALWRARALRGTRRRCWREFARASGPCAQRPKPRIDVVSTDPHVPTSAGPIGPVLFAYDGSALAELAIEQAGRQLAAGRDAVVVCAWQPAEVGFVPVGERHLDAADASEVREAAEETAAHG